MIDYRYIPTSVRGLEEFSVLRTDSIIEQWSAAQESLSAFKVHLTIEALERAGIDPETAVLRQRIQVLYFERWEYVSCGGTDLSVFGPCSFQSDPPRVNLTYSMLV